MANRRELAQILMNDTDCEGELIWQYIAFQHLPDSFSHITLDQWERFVHRYQSLICGDISDLVWARLSDADSGGELEED